MKRFVAILAAVALLCGGRSAPAQSYSSSPGTTSPFWHVSGASGPAINNSAGAIEARNAAISAFAIMRAATPVGSDDLTTKAYADGHVVGLPLVGPGGGTLVLTSTSGALSWAAAGAGGITQLTGRGTAGPGSGSQAFALAASGVTAATYGSSSAVPVFTISADGTISGVTNTTIAAPLGVATGMLALTQVGSPTGTGFEHITSGARDSASRAVNVSGADITGIQTVPNGGSGAATFAAHGVLLGEGTAAFAAPTLGNTQILVGQTSADPAAETVSGDATLGATGVLTFATVNGNVGSFGSSSTSPTFTVNAKGLVTAASASTIAAALGSATGTLALSQLAPGSNGQFLQSNGGVALWNALSQDVTCNGGGVCTVNSISGSSPFAISPASLAWTATTSAPVITQTAGAAGSTPQSVTVTPQTFNASSTTNVTNTPGGLTLALQSPGTNTVAGNEAAFKITRAGSGLMWMQPVPGSPTYGGLYLGVAPSGSNWAVASNGTAEILTAGASIGFQTGGAQLVLIQSGGVQLGFPTTATFGGGNVVTGLSDALTVPTAAAGSGGLAIYSSAHKFETNAAAIQFNRLVAGGTFTEATATSDVATHVVTFKGQDAFPSATTNVFGSTAYTQGGSGTTLATGGGAGIVTGDLATGIVCSAQGSGSSSSCVGTTEVGAVALTADVVPRGAGTVNTQTTQSHKYRATCRTTSATLVGCGGFIGLIPSLRMGTYFVHWSARDTTTPTGNTNAFGEFTFGYQENGSGSLIVVGAGAGVPTNVVTVLGGGTPPSGANFTTTTSGDTVRINVGGFVGTDTVDWQLDVDEFIN